MNELNTILQKMESISLQEMGEVKLMNRIDRKYVFHKEKLPEIMEACVEDYFLFKISGNSYRTYLTTYFDTPDLKMYNQHHNGKLNRYKIREREYADTGDKFFELKFKSNKNVTKKRRINITKPESRRKINEFVSKETPFSYPQLGESIKNKFTRITLVSKMLNERITIDFRIQFYTQKGIYALPDLVIIEQKKLRTVKHTQLTSVLMENRIFSTGFSKYCMGLVLTNKSIKANRFKSKVNYLKKLNIETNFTGYL
ncbi:MAG: polyphosphate polymerase domain-containing protein [Chlorobi bacterium]|nr:polyphosphate polymerase domain-containing protein [Chlorobiota bacterium]